ncbi:hypothetical protein [Ruania alba]|uniref:Uncharacterized protein n=1 Tax=Ruania alba TaxID=648782 RepID=A0A1H5BPT8_9MICO|nr:hypothetical protein [Ruania alba]SED56613.1 hypothetical protein SAMN04488554_0165 [Ruania alba]
MTRRHARLVRGSIAAGVSTGLAAVAHIAGGGAVPGVWGFLVPLIFSCLVAVNIAQARIRLAGLAVSTTVSHFAFHALFVVGTPTGQSAGSTGEHHHGAPSFPLDLASGVAPDAQMSLTHLTGALLTAVALHHAETVLAWLHRSAHDLLTALVGPREARPRPFCANRPGFRAVQRRETPSMRVILARAPHRGPPHLQVL